MRPLGYVIALVALTYAELWVTVDRVPHLIGAPATIGLIVASSIVGMWLLKQQSRAVWRRFRLALGEGRIPDAEIVDGMLVIFGGAFLIVPGFVTDAIGLFLLLPVTRPLARRLVERRITRSMVGAIAGAARRGPRPHSPDDVVDGSATEFDPDLHSEPRPRQLRH